MTVRGVWVGNLADALLCEQSGAVMQVIAALQAAADPSTVQAPNILPGTPMLMLNTDLYGAYTSQENVSAANGP